MVTTRLSRTRAQVSSRLIMETLEARTLMSASPFMDSVRAQARMAPMSPAITVKAEKPAPKSSTKAGAVPPIVNPVVQVGVNQSDRTLQIVAAKSKPGTVGVRLNLDFSYNERNGGILLTVSSAGSKTLKLNLNTYNGINVVDKTGGLITVTATDFEMIDAYMPWTNIMSMEGKVILNSVLQTNVTANEIYQQDAGFTAPSYLSGNTVTSETGGVYMSGLIQGAVLTSLGFLDTTFNGNDNSVITAVSGNNTVVASSGSVINLGDGYDRVTLYTYTGITLVNTGTGWDSVSVRGYSDATVSITMDEGRVLQFDQLNRLDIYAGPNSYLMKDITLAGTPDLQVGTIKVGGVYFDDLSNYGEGGKG